MKAEKVILSFIALLIGLAAAGIAFYFYQSSSNIKQPEAEVASSSIEPTETPTNQDSSLLITKPQDGTVIDASQITVSGSTTPDATVILRTETTEEVGISNSQGEFTMTIQLSDGVNPVNILSISKDGTQSEKTITITNTDEDF